ncbi:MAG: T9SS type A sorting domain-containing protein [Bacteroidota bacterium]
MRNILFPLLLILFFQLPRTVDGQITATIIGDASEMCMGDSVAAFLNFSGGEGPWNAVINDKDGEYLLLNAVTASHTIWLKPDSDNTYYIASVEDSKGTPGSPLGEAEILVHQSTSVIILMDRTAFLQSEPGIALVSSPTGGAFSGAGVAGSAFYPGIATPVGSPHTIHCTYTNEFGCVSGDNIDLHVLSGVASVELVSGDDIINAVCDDGATYTIQGSNEDNIPGTFDLVEAVSHVVVPGHISDPDIMDDEAILDPVGLTGAYDIVYSYGMDEVTVKSTFRFHVNDLGSIEILNLPDTVCKNDNPYPLVPDLIDNDPSATYSFSGPGLSGNQVEGYFYNPSSPDVLQEEIEITLDYTSSNGCNATTKKVVYNSYTPSVNFNLTPACLPVDGGTVSFTNTTSGKFSVASWDWDFGNPESGSDNFSDLEHPEHFYTEPGLREITLSATTHEGCKASQSIDTVLADQPIADFTWLTDCFIRSEQTSVMDRSLSAFTDIDTLIWTFKTSNGGVLGVIGSGSPADTIKFPFNSMDQYFIELYIENEVGCPGDVTKEFILKPTWKLATAAYGENFNGTAHDWLVDSPDEKESWVLDVPEFEGFNRIPGDMAWYTRLPDHTEGYLEESWVESPCFDFTGLTEPLIKLDLMKSFVPGTDGVVLQYQDLVSEGWNTLGNVGECLNWYNEWGIYNEPGESSFGWGLALFEPDNHWIEAVHELDMLVGHPHVKFRVVIATGGRMEVEPGAYNQGFAFDNFYVGEQNRCSLLEHFTNASSESAAEADSVVDTFSLNHSENVIDLNYHLDYPGEDAMNENNPYPASARSFYYGVSEVPYAILNGGVDPGTRYDFSTPSNEPNEGALKEASLEIPLFKMALQVDYLENSLEATTTVTCTADTFASNLQLYVVVIEREVTAYTGLNQDTSFRNVVLDMLPTPAGRLLGNEWNLGKSETRTFAWDYAAYVEDIDDLSVVAFVQDRDNGTILQVDAKPHTPGVGIPDKKINPRSLAVYPNPATDNLYVNFGSEVTTEGMLKIVDLSGREVMRTNVQPGYSIINLNISHFSRGMYMIYWMESGEIKGRNKLVFTR